MQPFALQPLSGPKRFKEPAWNYQVVRFLDAEAKDIIPRKDRVWTIEALAMRMVEALEKHGRKTPAAGVRVGVGLTADCTELSIEPEEGILLQTRPAFGGNVMATIANRYSRPQMATVQPGVMGAIERPENRGDIIRYDISVSEEGVGTRVLERVKEERKGVDLSQAKVIVAGGRGIGDASGFKVLEDLAAVIGGEVAGTRVAVEEGWIPTNRQIGQTGQSVRPELYIACGISGAIQHRAGMMNSRYVIAVNKDARAPIFQVADWGIVGDLHEVIPEMKDQLKTGGNQ